MTLTYTDGTAVPYATIEPPLTPGEEWEHDGVLADMLNDTTTPVVWVGFPGVSFCVPYELDGVGKDGDETYTLIARQFAFERSRLVGSTPQPKRVRNGSARKGSTLFTEAR